MKQYINVTKRYNDLLVRYIDNNNETKTQQIRNYFPRVFEVDTNNIGSKYKSFYGENLSEILITNGRDLKELQNEQYSLYGHKDTITSYINQEFDNSKAVNDMVNTAFLDIEVVSMYKQQDTWVDGGFPVAAEARYPISAITQYNTKDDTYYTFSLAPWDVNKSNLKTEDIKKVRFTQCKSEEELLLAWLNFWVSDTPAIVTGWNVVDFDLTYIVNRLIIVLGQEQAEKLSPWGIIEKRKGTNKFQQEITYYELLGVAVIDYADLYKKYRNKPREKYTLDFITSVELKDETKLKYEGSLNELFFKDGQLYNDYNIQDVRLLVLMEGSLNFISLVTEIAYFSGINFIDVLSPIKTWDTLIYSECLNNRIIVPYAVVKQEREAYEGAFVYPPVTGLKRKIISFDLTSLYPSIMRQWSISRDVIITGPTYYKLRTELLEILNNVGCDELVKAINENNIVDYYIHNDIPQVMVEFLQKNKITMSTNCQFYNIEKDAIFSKLINRLFKLRKENKKIMQEYKNKAEKAEGTDKKEFKRLAGIYDTKQNAMKVLLNSMYGAIGSPFFKYYMTEMAASITLNGQCIIQKSAKHINDYINKLLNNTKEVNYLQYIDTDSVYFEIDDVFQKYGNNNWEDNQITDFIDKICKKIESDVLQPLYEKLHYELNCNKDNKALNMDREVICIGSRKTNHCGFWTGKKRYALYVNDNEGLRYKEPNLKIMGLSCVQSSTPEICRNDIKESVSILIKDGIDDLREYASNVEKNFFAKTPEEIAFPKSVSSVDKYTDKTTKLPHKGTWFDVDSNKQRNGGVPINSAAAINYNYMIDKFNLGTKYKKIKNHDKMKFLYLRNNKYNFNVIGFNEELPVEFGLHNFIDYETHFEKSYYSPVDDILVACGSSIKKQASMDDFF